MGQCYGRESGISDDSDSWKNTAKKRRPSGGFYSLHGNCISNGTKNTLAFIRHQRGKLYIVRRCVTMLISIAREKWPASVQYWVRFSQSWPNYSPCLIQSRERGRNLLSLSFWWPRSKPKDALDRRMRLWEWRKYVKSTTLFSTAALPRSPTERKVWRTIEGDLQGFGVHRRHEIWHVENTKKRFARLCMNSIRKQQLTIALLYSSRSMWLDLFGKHFEESALVANAEVEADSYRISADLMELILARISPGPRRMLKGKFCSHQSERKTWLHLWVTHRTQFLAQRAADNWIPPSIRQLFYGTTSMNNWFQLWSCARRGGYFSKKIVLRDLRVRVIEGFGVEDLVLGS